MRRVDAERQRSVRPRRKKVLSSLKHKGVRLALGRSGKVNQGETEMKHITLVSKASSGIEGLVAIIEDCVNEIVDYLKKDDTNS